MRVLGRVRGQCERGDNSLANAPLACHSWRSYRAGVGLRGHRIGDIPAGVVSRLLHALSGVGCLLYFHRVFGDSGSPGDAAFSQASSRRIDEVRRDGFPVASVWLTPQESRPFGSVFLRRSINRDKNKTGSRRHHRSIGGSWACYCSRICAQGAHIGLLARGRAGLEGARREVETLGGQSVVVPTDVADADQVEAAAAAVAKQFGPIDIWVNDAMCSVFSPTKEMTPADYKRVTEVTYLGFVYGTLAALKRMLPRDRGIIVQVGSALAYRGIPLQSAYCGAKHAIQGFTESVRCELIHDHSNVKITMVQMPALNTPQFDWVKSRLPRKPQPVPPIYQPEVAADAIVHAAHHYRREWFVGGSTVVAIQGNKVAPGFGDWYLGQQGYGAQQYDGAKTRNSPTIFTHLSMKTLITERTAISIAERILIACSSGPTSAVRGLRWQAWPVASLMSFAITAGGGAAGCLARPRRAGLGGYGVEIKFKACRRYGRHRTP